MPPASLSASEVSCRGRRRGGVGCELTRLRMLCQCRVTVDPRGLVTLVGLSGLGSRQTYPFISGCSFVVLDPTDLGATIVTVVAPGQMPGDLYLPPDADCLPF